MYDGYVIRKNENGVQEWKVLKYNMSLPIINITADFLASKPVSFVVSNDEEATSIADKIWTESGGSAVFMENAFLGCVFGDACIMVSKKDNESTACFKWLDPSICYPEFDPHDYNRMTGLVLKYDIERPDGSKEVYKEVWREGTVKTYLEDKIINTESYDEKAFNGVPAVWIRNNGIKSLKYGISDIQPIAELVEQYDHLMDKMSRLCDYYSSPNIYFKGVTKKQMETSRRGERTIYYLPVDGEVGFVEWKGSPQGVQEHINQIREALSEVSQTPQIAFSKIDNAVSNVSGVALRLLYGPLLSKTHRKRLSWGPAMERAMHMALIVEGYEDIDLDRISIKWQDPLPENEIEKWQIAVEKESLGVSKEQILREDGYTQDEIDQFKKENEDSASRMDAAMIKQFSQGQVGGVPYPS
jgi:hypothetical protein